MYVYNKANKKKIKLLNKIGSGGEGDVYETNVPLCVAKIFKKTRQTKDLSNKIETMIKFSPTVAEHNCIAWPISILNDNKNKFVGYLMPEAKDSYLFAQILDPTFMKKTFPKGTWEDLLYVALNFANSIRVVHNSGHVIGDLNPSNVLVSRLGAVTLIDTDSYQVYDKSYNFLYLTSVSVSRYTAPEFQGINLIRPSRKPHTIYSDYFSMNVILFRLFMKGFHPFFALNNVKDSSSSSTHRYLVETNIKHGNCYYFKKSLRYKPPILSPDINILPKGFIDLFQRTFTDGNKKKTARASTHDWIYAINSELTQLKKCSKNNNHVYSSSMKACPWCKYDSKFSFRRSRNV